MWWWNEYQLSDWVLIIDDMDVDGRSLYRVTHGTCWLAWSGGWWPLYILAMILLLSLLEYSPGERLMEMANQQQQQAGVPAQKAQLDAEVCTAVDYLLRHFLTICTLLGTATRTGGILIHSRLKVLVVNLSRPSARLWFCAGLIGSNNSRWLKADLVVCANPSSSSWAWVGCECVFWYRLTGVVPDERAVRWLSVRVC